MDAKARRRVTVLTRLTGSEEQEAGGLLLQNGDKEKCMWNSGDQRASVLYGTALPN